MEAILHSGTFNTSGMNAATLNGVVLSSFAPGLSKKEITSNFLDASGCVIKTKDGLTFKTKENGIQE